MSSDEVRKGLATSRLADVTTTGRKSGKAARMEIPIFNVEGRLFIIGGRYRVTKRGIEG